MNCLSLLLNKGAAEGKFGYHLNCAGLKITHLCFADDLLIFTDGSLNSVNAIVSILNEFQIISGLALNPAKTSFFSTGLSSTEVSDITLATGFSSGTLPAIYLGLPLSSRKLTPLVCAPLIQKIKAKMCSWAAKSLSYGGRLLLLNSVISGLTNFWLAAFVIPKSCIKEINSLCGAFLWKGNIELHHSARVSWKNVTLPKLEGGLGLRDLSCWSDSCIIRLIWLVFFRPSSLWVAWFLHSLPWFQLQIGDGRHCRYWSSNW